MSKDNWPPKMLNDSDTLLGGVRSDWHLNACIGEQLPVDCGLDWYCDGFRRAARKLASDIIADGNSIEMPLDGVVYPLFYLYRHHLELRLKLIIAACQVLRGQEAKPPFGHDLGKLWTAARSSIEKAFPHADWTQNTTVSRLIGELSKVDPNGESGRYPDNRKLGKSFAGESLLNIRRFTDVIEQVCEYLACVSDAIEVTVDQMREMYAALR